MLTHAEKLFLVPYRQFSKRLFSLWLAAIKKFLKTENIKYPGTTPHIANLSVSALLNLGRQNVNDFDTYLPDGDPLLTNRFYLLCVILFFLINKGRKYTCTQLSSKHIG